MVISVGFLSGCDELSGVKVTGDTDEVELVNYDVFTKWKVYIGENKWGQSQYEYIETSGFRENEPDNSEGAVEYLVTGSIKNIAGNMLDKITVEAKFYDSNNNYLKTISDKIYNLANSYTEEFSMKYDKSHDYFENVDHIEFKITVS